MPELLAPVGNMEMLDAAIQAGADAVFLSGWQFGARAESANFDQEMLVEAIEKAHLYGVKVYLTLNTLIKEEELQACFDMIDWLCTHHVDAIIVQDLGVVRYLQAHWPDMPLHASTQMVIYDMEGLIKAKEMGISRVVVARETGLEVIREMVKADILELEVFVHGALCYGYSGQCLLSSSVGGRSGNRGLCAQPCRLSYTSEYFDDPSPLMSMKDLSTIEAIEEMMAIGIHCFKIEGRLRNPDYVYHTVKAYKMAMTGDPGLDQQIDRMKGSFSREFTGGHLLGEPDRLNLEMASNQGLYMGYTMSNDHPYKLMIKLFDTLKKGDGLKIVTEEGSRGIEVFNIYKEDETVEEAYQGDTVSIDFKGKLPRKLKVYRTRSQALTDQRIQAKNDRLIPITMSVELVPDAYPILKVSDGVHHVVVSGSQPVQHAQKAPLSQESIQESLLKLGDTPFICHAFEITLKGACFLAKSEINQLRREAMETLISKRIHRDPLVKRPGVYQVIEGDETPHVYVYVTSIEQYEVAKTYEGVLLFTYHPDLQGKPGISKALRPFVSKAHQGMTQTDHQGPLSISHFGQVLHASDYGCVLDWHSSCMNSEAFAKLKELGIDRVTLSPEITTRDSLTLAERTGAIVAVYGKIPVLYTRTCPFKQAGQSCRTCTLPKTIQDAKGHALTITCDHGLLTYSLTQPMVKDDVWRLKQRPAIALYFTDETADTLVEVLEAVTHYQSYTGSRAEVYVRPIH